MEVQNIIKLLNSFFKVLIRQTNNKKDNNSNFLILCLYKGTIHGLEVTNNTLTNVVLWAKRKYTQHLLAFIETSQNPCSSVITTGPLVL